MEELLVRGLAKFDHRGPFGLGPPEKCGFENFAPSESR